MSSIEKELIEEFKNDDCLTSGILKNNKQSKNKNKNKENDATNKLKNLDKLKYSDLNNNEKNN